MKKINVLVIGSGGREHALTWKLIKSPQAGIIYVAPGNPGTEILGCKNIPILPIESNFRLIADIANQLRIGLVVIGPEQPLAHGIVRCFEPYNIPVFGPDSASVIEYSKSYAKLLMRKAGIPTADFEIHDNYDKAVKCVERRGGRVVVKADGPASGKGVIVCHSVQDANFALNDLMVRKIHGKAGEKVVIEKLLEGEELSIHTLCDGEHIKMFPPVRDHKRLRDGNLGPMTGGMGAFGPIDVDASLIKTIEQKIVTPCIEELSGRGLTFVGCLYPGIMLTKDGPKVLEFNARFGDPETQVYVRLLEDDVDLIEVLLACTRGELNKVNLRWKDARCICVILAAEGYPDNPKKGEKIDMGSFLIGQNGDPVVFHSGTEWRNGYLCSNGGRVLGVTSLFRENSQREYAYEMIEKGHIRFPGMQYRKDIGKAK